MGWSKKGLKVMAELCAYCNNGERISLKHLQPTEPAYRPNKKLIQKAGKIFCKTAVQKAKNVTILSRGKVIPMFKCLRGLQNGNRVF